MLEFVLQAAEAMFPIIALVALGSLLSRAGWFDAVSGALIARLVTVISLPCSIFIGLTLPVASMLLAMVVGGAAARFLDIRPGRRGAFQVNYFISNTMFIGLPVNLALFGDESVPAVMLYYVVNTLLFWTLGVNIIVGDVARKRERFFSMDTLRKILSPSLLAFIGAILFVLSGFSLPDCLRATLRYTGNMTTPLSLLFIGMEVGRISLREFRFEKDIVWGLVGRYLFYPMTVLALTPGFPPKIFKRKNYELSLC